MFERNIIVLVKVISHNPNLIIGYLTLFSNTVTVAFILTIIYSIRIKASTSFLPKFITSLKKIFGLQLDIPDNNMRL